MAKEKEGKAKLSLVYYSMLEELAKVREFGVRKYGHREDWRTVDREDYFDAAIRHLNKAKAAELDWTSGHTPFDEESAILHLSHAATNIMFLIEGLRAAKEEIPYEG